MRVRQQVTVAAFTLSLLVSLGISVSALAQAQTLTVQLASQNNSGVTGTATIADVGGGKLKIDITANGTGAGPQPAHIHEGSCAQLNPAPKFALTDVRNGSSSTMVDGSLQTLLASPHAIHMHKSPDELPVYLACADIRAGTSAAAAPAGQPGTLPPAGIADTTTSLVAGLSGIGITLVAVGFGVMRRRWRSRDAQ